MTEIWQRFDREFVEIQAYIQVAIGAEILRRFGGDFREICVENRQRFGRDLTYCRFTQRFRGDSAKI